MKKVTDQEKENIRDGEFSATYTAFEKAGFTDTAIADELALIAFADMADFVDVDELGIVRAISFDELKKNKSRIIKKIKEKRVIRTEKGTKDKPDGEQILDSTFEFELYSKLDALEIAVDVKGLKKQKIEFPDKDGQPQQIGGLFTNMERASRLVYLLDKAAKRNKKNAKRGKKD